MGMKIDRYRIEFVLKAFRLQQQQRLENMLVNLAGDIPPVTAIPKENFALKTVEKLAIT